MDMTVTDAYQRSIQTLSGWLHREVNTSKTHVIYRTYAPVHFRSVQLFAYQWSLHPCVPSVSLLKNYLTVPGIIFYVLYNSKSKSYDWKKCLKPWPLNSICIFLLVVSKLQSRYITKICFPGYMLNFLFNQESSIYSAEVVTGRPEGAVTWKLFQIWRHPNRWKNGLTCLNLWMMF